MPRLTVQAILEMNCALPLHLRQFARCRSEANYKAPQDARDRGPETRMVRRWLPQHYGYPRPLHPATSYSERYIPRDQNKVCGKAFSLQTLNMRCAHKCDPRESASGSSPVLLRGGTPAQAPPAAARSCEDVAPWAPKSGPLGPVLPPLQPRLRLRACAFPPWRCRGGGGGGGGDVRRRRCGTTQLGSFRAGNGGTVGSGGDGPEATSDRDTGDFAGDGPGIGARVGVPCTVGDECAPRRSAADAED